MSNTEIWDALGKTDPAHTKAFSRSGGFRGTAVKPIWIQRRLTEQFGAAGIGWGVNEPKFEFVHASEGEVLVYCTVSAWHGDKTNVLWGVGGDKAVSRNKNGLFVDDEACKKAFTDAVGNAFKSLGVAADVHMGLFDDDKYVDSMREEFAGEPEVPPIVAAFLIGLRAAHKTNTAETYWADNFKTIPRDWREYVVGQKDQIKLAHDTAALVTAG